MSRGGRGGRRGNNQGKGGRRGNSQAAEIELPVQQPHSLKLHITLKSDLCPAKGEGFSSSVDQDICYDDRGVPYIPGRSLKGCLRSAAEDIGMAPEAINQLFGVRGSSEGGAVEIPYGAKLDSPDTTGGWAPTLARYTYLRANTSISRVTGAAEDESLRSVRVVKHYLPSGGEATFTASMTLKRDGFRRDEFVQMQEQLERSARALRNIGLERNRGLGAVRCVCAKVVEGEAGKRERLARNRAMVHSSNARGTVALSYMVRLDAPLMLPQGNGERSHPCIPGTSVLGWFASCLRGHEDFDDIFFSGKVRFSPLYPVDEGAEPPCRCVPAASFVAKVKGGRRNGDYCRADTFSPGALETIKPLKDGFMSPATWRDVETRTEIVYHHSKGEANLYTQECLSPGQLMAGFVECPANWERLFKEVLAQGNMRFGRSKTAQYARCSLVKCEKDCSGIGRTMNIEQGKHYALLLESDALVRGESACPSVALRDLEKSLRNANILGDWYTRCDIDDPAVEHCSTNVSARTVGGYNAKWNQKKPHVRVLSAGSCLVFTAACPQNRVNVVGTFGLRQPEGYGRVRLIALDEVVPAVPKETSKRPPNRVADQQSVSTYEEARGSAVSYAEEGCMQLFLGPNRLSSSFIGRLALMVDESEGATFDEQLDGRIASIREEAKRDGARALVNGLQSKLGCPMDDAEGKEDWRSSNWRLEKECLQLVLALGRSFQKQMPRRQVLGGGDES